MTKEIKPVKTTEASPEPLVTVVIDRKMTDGGIRVNDILYVGKVKVTSEQAEDLLRIQEEYLETKQKMSDPSQKIRIKSSAIIQKYYLADPSQFGNHPQYTKQYGLLDPWQWQFISDSFKEELKRQREAMYGI